MAGSAALGVGGRVEVGHQTPPAVTAVLTGSGAADVRAALRGGGKGGDQQGGGEPRGRRGA